MLHEGLGMRKTIATALVLLGIAAGCAKDPLSPLIEPSCSAPAPLLGVFDPRAPAYLVFFVDGTDPVSETMRLARLNHFMPTYVYGGLPGFSAGLSPRTVANVRCERSVEQLVASPQIELVPSCSAPAPLLGAFDLEAPFYIVIFVDGTDAASETMRLAQLNHFRPTHVYRFAFPCFAAPLSPEAVAKVRCERSVRAIQHDAVALPSD